MVSGGPVGPDTGMYGASVTKQFVGFLLALGVEAGRTRPDDRIRRWLPELPGWTDEVRLPHLLHHTSGLPDLAEPPRGIPASNEGTAGSIPAVGRTATQRAGDALRVQQRRLRPARRGGEPDHGPADPRARPRTAVRAARHGGDPAGRQDVARPGNPDPPGTVGDGGLWTTAADLATWLAAMNDLAIDSDAGRRVQQVGHLSDGTALDYAWGIRVVETPYGRQISHGGMWANPAGQDGPLPGEGRRRRRPEHRRHRGRDQPAGRRPGHPVGDGMSGRSSVNSLAGGSAGPRIVEDVR